MQERTAANLKRLGAAIRARRAELDGATQAELSRAAGISETTWNIAERGMAVSARSRQRIARALGWTPGSVDVVLDGGDPTLAEPDSVAPSSTDVAQMQEQVARLERVVSSMRADIAVLVDRLDGKPRP